MDNFYSNSQRQLQAEFASTGLADRLEQLIVKDQLDDEATAFIEAANFFFLSTVNEAGFPTVSHKGGDPGFVKIQSKRSLVFPCYDGNGMYYSMGNIAAHPEVGLLFISFTQPHRIRIQGRATLTRSSEITRLWPEVALAVEVTLHQAWVNCPRYIQTMQPGALSEFVPREGVRTPQPDWKHHEMIADVVPPAAHTLGGSDKDKEA